MPNPASLAAISDTANSTARAGTLNRKPWRHVVGSVAAATVVCLGLAACSGTDSKADAKPDSSEKSKEPSAAEKIAREALVSADLKALSDHKATSGKPEYTKSDRAPFSECAGSESKAMIWHVTQVFTGDPRLTVSGFAVDGDGTEVFYKLRKTWLAKACENHEAKGSRDDVTYVEVQEI